MSNRNEKLESEVREMLGEWLPVIASNRGPVAFSALDEAGRPTGRRGSGGLVTAMSFVLEVARAVWVACPRTELDRELAHGHKLLPMPSRDPRYELSFVDVDIRALDLHYNRISNEILWFAMHYLWDLSREPVLVESDMDAWDSGYLAVNRGMAEAVAGVVRQKSAEAAARGAAPRRPFVMIHDYHLLTCGAELRRLLPEAVITYFHHVPWPQPDYLRILPGKMQTDIFYGLLACDIVGFHIDQYGDNFLSCCSELFDCSVDWESRILTSGDSSVAVRTYPISIHPDHLRAEVDDTEVKKKAEVIASRVGDRKLILRIDRVEPTKNALRGFHGYALLLERHPELHGQVVFMACLYPSREDVAAYQDYVDEVRVQVAELNLKYARPGWEPVILHVEDDHQRSMAALTLYDVLLVNPIVDGMNLVAKEGPVLNARDGVLVLSATSGAAKELSDGAITVNPFDIGETAEALHRALTMSSKERGERSARLVEVIEENDSLKWLYHQLSDVKLLGGRGII